VAPSKPKKRSGRYGKVYSDILTDTKLGVLFQQPGAHRAFTVWALGLALAAQQLSDGVVHKADLRTLHGSVKDAETLVFAGFWEIHGDGWRYVKYEEAGNMTKAQVEHLKREGTISQCLRWMREKEQACTCGEHDEDGNRIANLVGDL